MNICLHWSSIAGSFECARELVCGSSDPQINAKNKFGETPLYVYNQLSFSKLQLYKTSNSQFVYNK